MLRWPDRVTLQRHLVRIQQTSLQTQRKILVDHGLVAQVGELQLSAPGRANALPPLDCRETLPQSQRFNHRSIDLASDVQSMIPLVPSHSISKRRA